MTQRVNVLWGILLSLLIFSMIWIGWRNYKISERIEVMKNKSIVLGTDEQLEETVNTLEKDLNERMAYETNVTTDPLDLTRTLQSRAFLASLGLRETLEQRGRMRLVVHGLGGQSDGDCKVHGPQSHFACWRRVERISRGVNQRAGDGFDEGRIAPCSGERVGSRGGVLGASEFFAGRIEFLASGGVLKKRTIEKTLTPR
jgi:hypothetical protein